MSKFRSQARKPAMPSTPTTITMKMLILIKPPFLLLVYEYLSRQRGINVEF
ncbi:hypothetical protein [Niallia sp. Marseille-Q9988]